MASMTSSLFLGAFSVFMCAELLELIGTRGTTG